MSPEEYCSEDATGLAALVKAGEVTLRELADTAAKAIDIVNPAIHAVIERFDDRIASLGDVAENPNAPFAGVPWLLKDIGSGEVGRKQEQGSRLMKGCVLEMETHLSTRMQNAGLVNIGRTAVPEFAYDGNTETVLEGSTRNPWDLSRSAGGSSGGASASVSSGIVPIAHASDGGGSIRLPASLNGLVGLKPTRGRVSTWPVFIADRPLGHATELAVSRTVCDTAGLLDAFHGPAPAEPQTLALPTEPFAEAMKRPLRNLKIAVNWDNGGPCPAHPAVVTAIKALAAVLQDEKHQISNATPDVNYALFAGAMTQMWAVEITASVEYLAEQLGRPLDNSTLEPNALGMIELARTLTGVDLMNAMLTQDACNKTYHEFLTDYDLLITPTTTGPAPKLGQTGPFTETPWVIDFADPVSAQICQYTFQANATGQPAISLPLAWTKEGLPIGVQIQARYGDEATLLQLAYLIEQAMPWADRRAPHHFTNLAGETVS